jgi:hypothetical protein
MHSHDFQRLEGVWTGTETITDAGKSREASGRLVFQTVFDGKFLLCDYVQKAPEHPTSVGHAVFRRDEQTGELSVTWFRSPGATLTQQARGVSEGESFIFMETIDQRVTKTTYTVQLNRLSIHTECSLRGGEWERIFEGSYRRQ